MAPARTRTRTAALTAVAIACAAPAARSVDQPPRAPRPAAAGRAGAPTGEAPPGLRYGDEPQVTLTPIEAACLARLATGGDGGSRTRASGALILAARQLARRAAADEPDPIGAGARRRALARAGAADPAPSVYLVRGPTAELAAALARAAAGARGDRLGLGAAPTAGGAVVVLLASSVRARLDPFPRVVPPGSSAVLSGSLEAGLSEPRAYVTLPSGEVRELPGSAGPGRRFRAPVEFPVAGRYALEVVGAGPGGPEVAALLEVDAGPVPDLPVRPRAGREPEPGDEAAAGAAVLSALNALRAEHGLPSLRLAKPLSAVARRHSEAMRAAGRIAHVLPTSPGLVDRLRAARLPYRRASENVASGGGVLAAHAAAEESPAHRANMLDPAVSEVGVGTAVERRGDGGATVYLTEIFVEPPEAEDRAGPPPEVRVREALWRERERLGGRPLAADPALDALAAEAARAMRERDDADPGALAARALALPRRLAAADVLVVTAPADAARAGNLRDGRFRRIGVGVAAGDSARYGPGRIFVAVVYTD